MDDKEKEWTLRELAAETGVPERTIRFYISRGLVDPPLRSGRGAAYGAGHKARLEEIRKLQAEGLMLAEIAHVVAAGREGAASEEALLVREPGESAPGPHVLEKERPGRVAELHDRDELAFGLEPRAAAPFSALPAPEDWRAYGVAGDAIVMFKAGAAPWRARQLQAALRRFAAMINDAKGDDPKEG